MTRYQKLSTVVMREMDDVCYLVNTEENAIFELNVMGRAIWHLLQNPTSSDEIIETLQTAFPEVAPETITSDVLRLLDLLLAQKLIIKSL